LRAELDAFGAEPERLKAAVAVPEALSRELFARAVAAREAWAGAHAEELVVALSTAVRVVEQERSVRALFRSEPEAARALCRLFAIWGSTLLSLGNCFPADLGGIARLVIDEAGQCHPAHAVSALLRAEAALVIGDVHQLSPVIDLSADDEERLLRSCRLATPAELLRPYRVHADATVSSQSLADRAVKERGNLTDHFRCQPEIIALSDALCDYGLSVHTPHADRSRHAPYLTRPVLLVDLRGQQARLAGSWCNELELEETLTLVESLLSSGVQLEEIAVITPYRGQLEQLRRGFLQRRIAVESSPELAEGEGARLGRSGGVALGTVHRFQGGERSIVLFSSVVTHPSSLAFLNARPNLLNVAISRAQHHFVCLGHAAVLARGPRSRLLVDGVSTLSTAAYRGAYAGTR
jgi:superfamily I DNA and/or RNA helicase